MYVYPNPSHSMKLWQLRDLDTLIKVIGFQINVDVEAFPEVRGNYY